jgi:hypothetical protein
MARVGMIPGRAILCVLESISGAIGVIATLCSPRYSVSPAHPVPAAARRQGCYLAIPKLKGARSGSTRIMLG